MDKKDFLKALEEMLSIAKTNGNQITKEELLDYFSDIPMNEEAKKLLFDTYEEAGIRIIGYEKEKTGEKKEEREAEEQKESEVLAFYKKEVEGLDLPDEDSQKQLLKEWLEGQGSQEQIIECLLPAVMEIARRHKGEGVLYADLIQEGNIGLLEAVGTYEGKDEEEFLKYAARAVEEAMLNSIAAKKGSDSIGEQMAMKANRLDEASSHLAKELGREPKAEELAEYLSMTIEEVKDIMKISLDAISVMETDITLKES